MSLISEAQIRTLAPRGKPNLIAAIAGHADRVFPKYHLDQLARAQVFIGLVIEETGGLTAVEEDLQHYSAERIHQVWPSRFATPASAAPYANNARGLANAVYNGRMGNRSGSDDGYNFRGRGGIQVTGRDNYTQLAKQLGADFVNHPELVLADTWFLETSVALFVRYPGILQACDVGNVDHVWTMVGGGRVNIPAHQQALTHTRAVITKLGSPSPAAAPPAQSLPKPAAPPPVAAVAQPPKEIKPMTTVAAPVPATTQNQTILAVLTKMEASIEPTVVGIADKLLPWFVPSALVNGIIHDGLMKGVALAAGATTGVMQSVPTAQKIVETALEWADAHTPSFLKGIVAPLEEQVVIEAQKLGLLPPDFSIEHAPAAPPQAKVAQAI